MTLEGWRHPFGWDFESIENLRRPVPAPQIKQDCARAVGFVHRERPGELESYIIFRQQDVAGACEYLRLVILHPPALRRGEPCQGFSACDLNEALPAYARAYFVALIGATLIVPEDRGSERLLLFVQKNKTVHLSSQADRRNRFAGSVRLKKRLTNAGCHGLPPVFGVLLGPERPWRR